MMAAEADEQEDDAGENQAGLSRNGRRSGAAGGAGVRGGSFGRRRGRLAERVLRRTARQAQLSVRRTPGIRVAELLGERHARTCQLSRPASSEFCGIA